MDTVLQDLRYGWRMLAKDPGAALVMTLTLALAIGANTAIFSVVYGVLLRPLPYPKPNQIISVSEVAADGHLMNFADQNFDDLRASNHTLIGMAEYESNMDTVVVGVEAARVGSAAVSGDFFRVMGVAPMLGREFSPEEQHPGAAPAALVGYGYWRRHLGNSADLGSFKLKIEDKVYSVVGVLPPGFSFPEDTEVWVPRELFEHITSRTAHNWKVVARLRATV
jgi:putative ABC transport system permease protein